MGARRSGRQSRVPADGLMPSDAPRIASWTGRDDARRLYGPPVSEPVRDPRGRPTRKV